MSACERPSAHVSRTFKPIVRGAHLWPIGCPELAASVNTTRRQEDDFQRDGPAGQSLLGVTAGETRSRPGAGIQQRPLRGRLIRRACGASLNVLPSVQCPNYGGELKIIAANLERPVIKKILTHLGPGSRPPPKGMGREVRQGFRA